MNIRPITPQDRDEWLRLRCALWPEAISGHPADIEDFFKNRLKILQAVLVAEAEPSPLIGFAELSIRAYAEGCETDHVGYLEGWYVDPDYRGAGVGRQLMEAFEDWARQQGCTEVASDTEFHNEASAKAHAACGFKEVESIRCFRKVLL